MLASKSYVIKFATGTSDEVIIKHTSTFMKRL